MGLPFLKRSTVVEAETEALAKFADPRAAEARRTLLEGDLMDRLRLRTGLSDTVLLGIAAACLVMFSAELVFAYTAGNGVYPQLAEWRIILTQIRVGGAAGCAVSILGLLMVKVWAETDLGARPSVDFKDWLRAQGARLARNVWSGPLLAIQFFAFIMVYVSQSMAADDVAKLVAQRNSLSEAITKEEAAIPADRQLLRSPGPTLRMMEGALDQAVGAGLSRVSTEDAAKACAGVKDIAANIACIQQRRRAGVDCAQSMSATIRETVCLSISGFKSSLDAIAEDAQKLADREKALAANRATLKALPPAASGFIEGLSRATGWELPDTRARFYVGLSLLFQIVPAWVLALATGRRRKPVPPAPDASPPSTLPADLPPTALPQGGTT